MPAGDCFYCDKLLVESPKEILQDFSIRPSIL